MLADAAVKPPNTYASVFDPLASENLIVPDTNVLIDFPDLRRYHLNFPAARVVFTPTILEELDARKRCSSKSDTKAAARNVIRQIKDASDGGDILEGVRVGERLTLMTSAREPGGEGLLDCLDLGVPDDRFIASALEVRRTHPKAQLLVLSGDYNVLNKAHAARLAAIDPEKLLRDAATKHPVGDSQG
jgi:predicted ribonuclease YlaK